MVTTESFAKIALSFSETTMAPHFETIAFKVGKKIFATLHTERHRVCLNLRPADQDIFCCFDAAVIYAVPNRWGQLGWTFVELKKVRKEMLVDALKLAFCKVAPKRLSGRYLNQ